MLLNPLSPPIPFSFAVGYSVERVSYMM